MTPNAWKWPALWPYTPDYFDRPDESEDEKAFQTPRTTPCLEGSSKEALVSHYARFLTSDSTVLEIGELDIFFFFLVGREMGRTGIWTHVLQSDRGRGR